MMIETLNEFKTLNQAKITQVDLILDANSI